MKTKLLNVGEVIELEAERDYKILRVHSVRAVAEITAARDFDTASHLRPLFEQAHVVQTAELVYPAYGEPLRLLLGLVYEGGRVILSGIDVDYDFAIRAEAEYKAAKQCRN